MKKVFLPLVIALGLGLALALLGWLRTGEQAQAAPAATTRYVAPGGNCGSASPCYATIQAAVDAATDGDTIKVAQGTYTGVQTRTHSSNTFTQTVFISKTVIVQGGYTTSDWNTLNPKTHPAILNANGAGRVVTIIGNSIAPTLRGLCITGGQAGGSLWDRGGGIYVSDANGIIEDCLIYSNTVSYYGGGVYIAGGNIRLTGNTIASNTVTSAGDGAGVYISSGSPVLERNTIQGNWTLFGAGGVTCYSSCSARLVGNVIADNTGSEGGGIELLGNAEVVGNLIQRNTAPYGGGVYIWGSNPTLVNNAVVDNIGTYRGAGIYVTTGSSSAAAPRLLHNTIARNSGGPYGDGSAVYVQGKDHYHCAVALTNTIIFSHSVGITVTAGNTATLNGTLWHTNGTDRGGAGTISHQNDYSGDPYFAADGYHLLGCPGALDRGVNAGVTTDIDGDQRPIENGYDLGADETARKFFIYLPLIVRNH